MAQDQRTLSANINYIAVKDETSENFCKKIKLFAEAFFFVPYACIIGGNE